MPVAGRARARRGRSGDPPPIEVADLGAVGRRRQELIDEPSGRGPRRSRAGQGQPRGRRLRAIRERVSSPTRRCRRVPRRNRCDRRGRWQTRHPSRSPRRGPRRLEARRSRGLRRTPWRAERARAPRPRTARPRPPRRARPARRRRSGRAWTIPATGPSPRSRSTTAIDRVGRRQVEPPRSSGRRDRGRTVWTTRTGPETSPASRRRRLRDPAAVVGDQYQTAGRGFEAPSRGNGASTASRTIRRTRDRSRSSRLRVPSRASPAWPWTSLAGIG